MRTLFLLSACLLMAACTGRSSQASNDDEAKPVITVTLEPQRYFTEAIAGDKFKVVSMVPKVPARKPMILSPNNLCLWETAKPISASDTSASNRPGWIA